MGERSTSAGPRPTAEFNFSYAGLFILVFAATQAGLIVYYRSGLYLPARLVCLSLGLIGAAAFAPFLAPDKAREKIGSSLYLYPLLSFAVLLPAFGAYAAPRLAPALVYIYPGLALAGLWRSLPRLRGWSARHAIFLALAAPFSVYVRESKLGADGKPSGC